MRVEVTRRNGEVQVIEGKGNYTLMEAIRNAGIHELLALCGGCRSCATCHVYVDPEFFSKLDPATADEKDLLDSSSHAASYSRLSCQIKLTDELDGLRVTIAPED